MCSRPAWLGDEEGSVTVTRVLSGIQPTGGLHLGNYLGAIRRWVDEQGRQDAY